MSVNRTTPVVYGPASIVATRAMHAAVAVTMLSAYHDVLSSAFEGKPYDEEQTEVLSARDAGLSISVALARIVEHHCNESRILDFSLASATGRIETTSSALCDVNGRSGNTAYQEAAEALTFARRVQGEVPPSVLNMLAGTTDVVTTSLLGNPFSALSSQSVASRVVTLHSTHQTPQIAPSPTRSTSPRLTRRCTR